MKRFKVTSLLLLTMVAPAAARAQDTHEIGHYIGLDHSLSNRVLLLDPDLETLKTGKARQMTVGVSAGSPVAKALKEAFRKHRLLGSLVLAPQDDGAILIVSAADGPMPHPRGPVVQHFPYRITKATVVSVRPHTRRGAPAMEAITIAYEGFERGD